MIQPARKYAVAAMVPTASQRIILSPRRIISVAPTDDHTHAFLRAPESFKKLSQLQQKQKCGGRGEVTPLPLQVGRVAEGVVTHRTTPFTGHGFGRSRRGNERHAPALAPQGGDVGPVVQVDQLHFHTRLSPDFRKAPPGLYGNGLAQHSRCTCCSPTNGYVSGSSAMRSSQTGQIGFPWASSRFFKGGPPCPKECSKVNTSRRFRRQERSCG